MLLRRPGQKLLACALLALFASSPRAQSAYQGTIDRWKAQDALNPPPKGAVVFVGSSSVRFYEWLTRDFADYYVLQRGFGGSQFTDLNQFVDEIVLDYEPSAVCVFEGTNDVASGKSAQTVFDDYLTFVDLVHTGQDPGRPPIPILYIGITPTPSRWSLWPVAEEVNALVEAHAATDPSLFYLDVPTPFLATGQPPSTSLFRPDQLHLNRAGYVLWHGAIRPGLESALAPNAVLRPNPSHPAAGERLLLDLGPQNPQDGNPTGGPDPFGQIWNDWHFVSGGSSILAGEHEGDLVTTAGVPSGIDLVMTGEFQTNGIRNGGLLEPSPALLGQLAIATATQDYFFGDDVGGSVSMGYLLENLDPRLTYDLRFFASRRGTLTQVTRYVVAGADEHARDLQTTGAGIGFNGYDGNDDTFAVFRRVSPDPWGRIFVDLEKVTGNFGYVALMELVVRPPVRGRTLQGPGPR